MVEYVVGDRKAELSYFLSVSEMAASERAKYSSMIARSSITDLPLWQGLGTGFTYIDNIVGPLVTQFEKKLFFYYIHPPGATWGRVQGKGHENWIDPIYQNDQQSFLELLVVWIRSIW